MEKLWKKSVMVRKLNLLWCEVDHEIPLVPLQPHSVPAKVMGKLEGLQLEQDQVCIKPGLEVVIKNPGLAKSVQLGCVTVSLYREGNELRRVGM